LHTTLDDLDLDLFKTEYLPKFVKASVLKNDKRGVKQQLASLQLFDLSNDCPTVAGILLIGKNPKQVLFGSYIQYVQFAGRNRASQVLNERQFSGNLLTMLKELDYFIKYTIQKQRPVFVTVLREEMRINYPYEAIRELAMNLVMHRNYQTNSPAKFYEYSDRIEMDNPGNLYGKVRPDNFPNETDYRNPVIAVAMKTLGYVNQFGRGVETVQEELMANKNGLALFKFDDITTFKVTVMSADAKMESDTEMSIGESSGAENDADDTEKSIDDTDIDTDDTENLSSREKSIINLMKDNNSISRRLLAKKMGISTATVARDINSLKEKGIIERIGGDRGGYWKIK
jgi:ATP-dependent DNA helicase RecG